MTIFEYIILIVPTILLLVCYFYFRQKTVVNIAIFWVTLIFLLFFYGWIEWDKKLEISQLGNGLLLSSSIWFTGIFLVLAVKRNLSVLTVVLITPVVSLLSFYFAFFILAGTNQIWGM